MLIVSRRIDESIQIGDDITVTVLDIKGRQARIGISAPDDVNVHREEIYERVVQADLNTVDHLESAHMDPASTRRRILGLSKAQCR